MDRKKKIQMLQLIEAGKLKPSALRLETGIYRRVEDSSLYKHKDTGETIELTELLKTVKQLGALRTLAVKENENLPWYVIVSEAVEGQEREETFTWKEEKKYDNEIVCQDKETGENITKLFT